MGVVYGRCRDRRCGKNMWPPQQLADHVHLSEEDTKRLKKKYRVGKRGWDKVPAARSNSPKGATKTLAPRRRAYGPF